ncbi:MAG: hypothetical protein OHK93_000832 [Ramalina farinacea]|uniref:NmrA-like domain-containing protein n=1 Tax=Ramalina farinacea TaxID=258253 RepID=A0AA43QSM2_9LECA|nr:hypothetical protein [Ramalina farinacea]
MPKNILTVFGATGNQGSSLIRHVLGDPHLSTTYTIRAVARDPSSPSAQSLQSLGGAIELVKGDLNDEASIASALKDTHTVFLVTISDWSVPPDSLTSATEYSQGKAVADVSLAAGVAYLIFSSEMHVAKGSNNRITSAVGLDVKAEVESYIRSLCANSESKMKSAFFHPGTFMQNFNQGMLPRPLGDGTYGLFNFVNPTTKFPVIDIAADTGKFVSAILASPDTFSGKSLSAATYLKSLDEIAEIMTKVSGKPVKYMQVPRETMESFMAGAGPGVGRGLCDMFLWMQEVGYYGPQTAEKVEWTVGQVGGGGLTSLEEYLGREPLKL